MFKKSLYTAFSFFLLVSWVIFAPAALATEIEIYPGGGNAAANATSDGWTDNHLVGQTFTVPANVYKINRIRLTNFKLGMAGQNNGGIVQVLLYAGAPGVSQVEVSPGVKTTKITPDPNKLVSSIGPVYVAAWKLNHYLADLCAVDRNSTEDYALTELQINDPRRPCPETWGKGGSTFIRADFDGTNRLRTVFPWGNAYSEGTGWQSDTTLEVPFPNNTVTPGGTYYIAIQQIYMQNSDYIDSGKYNCTGPLSLSTPGDGGGLCAKDQVFVTSLSTNNPYGGGQAYFNTYYYDPSTSGYNPATGDLANFKVWGETTFNNAACASIAAPDTVNINQTFSASVQMNNTGTTTWTSGGNYHVGSQNPQDNTTWGSNRANLSAEPVGPNGVGTFTFTATAPSTPGTYAFGWRMVQDGVEWFGNTCQKTITVPAFKPEVTSLTVTNANSGNFSGSSRASGRQISQQGKSWFNPMIVEASADPGSGQLKSTYVAFYYGQALNTLIQDVTTGMPVQQLQNILSADPSKGVLMAYDNIKKIHYVWDPQQGSTNKWVNITGESSGIPICGSAGCNTQTYYRIYPGDPLSLTKKLDKVNTWTVRFDKNFGSKMLRTTVQAVNSYNLTVTKNFPDPL